MTHLQCLTRFRFFAATLLVAVALGGACNCEEEEEPTPDVGVDDVIDDDVIDDVEDVDEEDVVEDADVTEPPPDIPEGLSRVQIIHDVADPAAATVDLYVGGDLLVDDFDFRTATPYVDIDAGQYDVVIAGPDSESVDDGLVTFEDVEFAEQTRYVIVASGVLDPTEFEVNPDERDTAVTLYVIDQTREESTDASFDQLLLFHGVTDAPAVDLFAENSATLVSDLGYGDFSDGYLSVPPGITVFDLLVSATQARINSYQTPSLAGGDAYVVVASGFLDDTQNEAAPFELLAYASPFGGDRVDPITLEEAARLQIVHDSADPAASQVDIYADSELLAENVEYRTATPFLTYPSGVALEFAVTEPGVADPDDNVLSSTFEFTAGSSQIAVVSGVIDPGEFPDNPDDLDTDLAFYAFGGALESGTSGSARLLGFHGLIDAPTVGLELTADGDDFELSDELAYGEFTGYLAAPADPDAILTVLPNSPPMNSIVDFSIDLDGFSGEAALLSISGIFDGDTDPDVALVVISPNGDVLVIPPDE